MTLGPTSVESGGVRRQDLDAGGHVGSLLQHLQRPEALLADGHQDDAAVGVVLMLGDSRNGADVEGDGGLAHLDALLDEHDAEAGVLACDVLKHLEVAGLEELQRQLHAREEHGAQGEEREVANLVGHVAPLVELRRVYASREWGATGGRGFTQPRRWA